MERRRLIGEILVDHGWCTAEDINTALKQQAALADQGAADTMPLGGILVEMGKVTEDQIRQALEEQGRTSYQEAETDGASSEVWGVTDERSKTAQENAAAAATPSAQTRAADTVAMPTVQARAAETAARPSIPARAEEATARPSTQTRAPETTARETPVPVAASVRGEERNESRSSTMNTGSSEPRNDPSWRPGADYDNERRGILGIPWLQYVIVPTVAATAIMFGVKWYLNRRRKQASRMEWLRNQLNDASDRISSMRK